MSKKRVKKKVLKTPPAKPQDNLINKLPLNFLVAYPYLNDKENLNFLRQKKEETNFRLIVDSGAFTAWNSGKKIELDEYCKFLDQIEYLRPFYAVQLDVFGDPEASYKNLLTMKSRGYDVMPVFTRGDSEERLEEYYQMTDYIMFGGIVIGGKNTNYVKWFLNRNKGRKCHWLGFVNLPFIKKYKPESVDSSSWTMSARYGSLVLYNGFGQLKSFERKDFAKAPTDEMMRMFHRVGIEKSQVKHLGQNISWSRPWYFEGNDWRAPTPGMAQFVTTLSHLMRAREIEKQLGTKVFMAGNIPVVNKFLFRCVDYLEKNGLWT